MAGAAVLRKGAAGQCLKDGAGRGWSEVLGLCLSAYFGQYSMEWAVFQEAVVQQEHWLDVCCQQKGCL